MLTIKENLDVKQLLTPMKLEITTVEILCNKPLILCLKCM